MNFAVVLAISVVFLPIYLFVILVQHALFQCQGFSPKMFLCIKQLVLQRKFVLKLTLSDIIILLD